ncbi:LysM peptidoglycan-binding domain-containing protein [Flexivirga endophytica]|nr:LysM peptidoglycan-binding domain-containing protein [Flexivirga endophytica]GHB37910.1 hypothetical protein GCM10008112_03160 [Flexivirga endophytica]
MSAVAWTEAPADLRQGRRHLRAVPTGPAARGGGPVVGVRVEPTGLRLTARGRRLVGVLVVVALLIGGGAAARAWATTPAPTVPTVTVHQGETLSGVAHRAYPSMQVSDAVTKVALANDLNGLQVSAGQQLRLPR